VAPRAEPYGGRVALLGLRRPRAVLYERIDTRTRFLFAHGLVEEVRSLLARGYGPELRPMTGHGYREVARYLAGEWPLAEATETTARRTRQYAKRQLTWFGRDGRIMWLDAGSARADDEGIVDRAERLLRAALA
jgi:tRNA dimethylallyltransferase